MRHLWNMFLTYCVVVTACCAEPVVTADAVLVRKMGCQYELSSYCVPRLVLWYQCLLATVTVKPIWGAGASKRKSIWDSEEDLDTEQMSACE